MENSSHLVLELLKTIDKKDKLFLGKNPSLKEITQEMDNFKKYDSNGEINGLRVHLGEIYILDNKVVGYNSFIVFNNAKPTEYEKKIIDMGNGLNYFYFKKLYVHPENREKGICSKFVEKNLEIASKLDKHSIIDVNRENYKIINILSKFDFQEDFDWTNPKGNKMVRFFHD